MSLSFTSRSLSYQISLAGEDFVGIFEQVLTFEPGDVRKCTTLTVIEDDTVEGDETLIIQIQSSMVLIGTPRITDITILDTSRKLNSTFMLQFITCYRHQHWVCINGVYSHGRSKGLSLCCNYEWHTF